MKREEKVELKTEEKKDYQYSNMNVQKAVQRYRRLKTLVNKALEL